MKNTESLTKEDATRMMNVSRKETECVVKELLRKVGHENDEFRKKASGFAIFLNPVNGATLTEQLRLP